MRKIIRLTESELTNLIKQIVKEQNQDDYLPIKELVIGSSFADSHVILTNGEEYPVKYSASKCPTGTYTQDQIPIDCNAIAKINGETRFCNSDGCGYSSTHNAGEVVVSRPSPYIEFDLKEPIDDFNFIKYDKRTGEILGNGQKGHVVARTQPNKDEDWVRDWFRRNRIKVF